MEQFYLGVIVGMFALGVFVALGFVEIKKLP